MKAHIAVLNIPAHGHINPTLAIIKELVSRQFRVTYATTEEFASTIRAMGAEPALFRSAFPSGPITRDLFSQNKDSLPLLFLDEATHVLPQFEEIFKNDKPDLVIYDSMSIAGRLYVEKNKVPAIQFFSSHADNDHFSLSKTNAAFDPSHLAMQEFTHKLNLLRAKYGLPAANDFRPFSGNANLNIVFLPRFFQYEGNSFDEKYVFVGPCLGDRSFQGSWTPPNEENPLLFISLGTVFNAIWPEFYEICLDAFFDLNWNIIMSVGTSVDQKKLGMIPPQFQIYPHVPQLEVLSRAKVFISHGGMGSTMEAISYGVPIIAIPQMFEQEANAKRIEELGLGKFLSPEITTPEKLREVFSEIATNVRYFDQAKEMQKQLKEAGGLARAVNTIEGFLQAQSATSISEHSVLI